MHDLLESVQHIAVLAGQEILDVYHDVSPIDVTTKDDASPLTQADTRANNVIVEQLQSLDSAIPILSEEIERPEFATRATWERYWLVDPLDGTKEFINRNGEFTVNIALIEDGEPVLGVVHVPVSGSTYFGGSSVAGAWKKLGVEDPLPLRTSSIGPAALSMRLVASRSHRGELVDRLVEQAGSQFENIETMSMGSSLKLCLVAEGSADLYPRLAPTSEWDTAAAHAVVRAAGGEVVTTDFIPLRYNQKESLLNPHFLVIGDQQFDWQALLAPALA